MARVAKIDNAIKKRFERIEKKRPVNTRDERVYFLIVCEGERTEPQYFEALASELPVGSVEIKLEGTGRNTIGLVEHTIQLRDKSLRTYDQVWAVFDKDDFPDKNFNNAIAKANSHNIKCAWTNEAFELWFLLHFRYVSTATKREDYKGFLESELQAKSGDCTYRYEKKDPNMYSLLKKYGNQEQAIKWAEKLKLSYIDQKYAAHNPCTLVHELIEELNPKKVLGKKKN